MEIRLVVVMAPIFLEDITPDGSREMLDSDGTYFFRMPGIKLGPLFESGQRQ